MGKIFSVEIEYAFYSYKALVSVFRRNHEPVFHVQFIDNFLKEIFQTEHIRYKGVNGYQHCDVYNDDLAEVMISRIAKAIDLKLYGRTGLIRKLFLNDQII